MQEVPSEAQCLQPGRLCGHSAGEPVAVRTSLIIFNKAPHLYFAPGLPRLRGPGSRPYVGTCVPNVGPTEMSNTWPLTSVAWTENPEKGRGVHRVEWTLSWGGVAARAAGKQGAVVLGNEEVSWTRDVRGA